MKVLRIAAYLSTLSSKAYASRAPAGPAFLPGFRFGRFSSAIRPTGIAISASRSASRSRSRFRSVGGPGRSLSSSPSSATSAFAMSARPVTERSGDGTITVRPADEAAQSALVVLCHGLGDSAEGFADVAEQLGAALPHVKFVLPTAPTQPVTMNMGMPMPSWYDITGLDERSNEQCAGIDVSAGRIRGILRAEHAENGLPYSRMLLAGFSQGGALSLFVGMQSDPDDPGDGTDTRRLAGILVMSGYLPAASKFAIGAGLEDTPILHCHGEADPMVRYQMAQQSREAVTGKGATRYDLKGYPGLPHSVSPQEIADVLAYLQEVLPPDDASKIKLKDPASMSVKELRAAIRRAGLGSQAVGLMEKSEFVKLLRDHREGGKS